MSSLRHLDGLAHLQALDPITAAIEAAGRVVGLVQTEQQASIASSAAQQQAALDAAAAERQQQQQIQQMVDSQVRADQYARIAAAVGAIALFGAAGYLVWKAFKR